MTTLIDTDTYGRVTRYALGVLRSHNVPPALYDELADYFRGDLTRLVRYVKSKGRSNLNYGDVFRDQP